MLHELIEPRTTLLTVALLYVVLPLNAWYAMADQRSTQVAQWCGAGLIAAVGVGLIGARGSMPDVLSFHLGNSLTVAAMLIWAQVLRGHLGRSWSTALVPVATLTFLLAYTLIHVWSPTLSSNFSRLVLCLLSLQIAWLAGQAALRFGMVHAWPIALVYGLLAMAFAYQIGGLVLEPGRTPDPFSPTTDAALVAMAALATAVVGSFSYVGLVLGEAIRHNSAQRAEQARLYETIRLAREIARLDRDQSLQLVSASISHELRQPLTAALTNAQVATQGVLSGRASPATLTGLLDHIETNIRRTADILDRLRNLRSDGHVPHNCLDLRTLLKARVDALHHTLLTHGIRVDWNMDCTESRVHGDPLELSQVIDNILRNAIEAMVGAPKRLLSISLENDEHHLRLRIRDSGKGLEPSIAAQVTEVFFTTKSDGMGVGLSLSRALIERHGGNLLFETPTEGGACVSIELPIRCGQAGC